MSELAVTRQRKTSANRGFVAIVVLSLFVHSAAIAGVLYRQHRRPSVVDVPSSIPVQLVALGKKRDPNLLPRKVEELPAAPPESAGVALDTGKTEPVDPNKAKTKTAPKKLSDAAKRLLEGSDSKLEEALDKIEEREGDPEGDIHGTTTDTANAAKGYEARIGSMLRSRYQLPQTISASERPFLKAQVALFIEADGTISKFDFIESHPNEVFMHALEAMLKSIKLPPPPPAEAERYREVGVILNFKP